MSPRGNIALFEKSKTAFLCSQRCPGAALLKATDWVSALDPEAVTLIGGWHTPVEKEVLRLALRRKIPLIAVEARSPRRTLLSGWQSALDDGRMLLVHPIPHATARINAKNAADRIRWVIAHADTLVVAHASPNGTLAAALAIIAPSKIHRLV